MFGKWYRCWSFWSPRILPKTILKWTKRRVSNFTYLSPREKQVDKKRFVCLNLFYSSRILNFFCSRSRPFGGSWSIRTIGEVGTWRCGSLDHESRSLHPRKTQGAPKRFVEKCVFFVGNFTGFLGSWTWLNDQTRKETLVRWLFGTWRKIDEIDTPCMPFVYQRDL